MPSPDDEPVPYLPTDAEATGNPSCAHVGETGLELWQLGVVNADMHPLIRLVALVLATRADQCGALSADAQPSMDDLQTQTGLRMPDLYHALGDLEQSGWIATSARGIELTLPASTTR